MNEASNAPSNAAPNAGLADRLRIVLVGTQHPGNIGAAARAMKTMGLARLVLVAPERAPDRDTEAIYIFQRVDVGTAKDSELNKK